MITKFDIAVVIGAVLFCCGTMVHSQQAAGKSALQVLQDVKAANASLIDSQKKTLDTLDDMEKTAEQIKILGKRG